MPNIFVHRCLRGTLADLCWGWLVLSVSVMLFSLVAFLARGHGQGDRAVWLSLVMTVPVAIGCLSIRERASRLIRDRLRGLLGPLRPRSMPREDFAPSTGPYPPLTVDEIVSILERIAKEQGEVHVDRFARRHGYSPAEALEMFRQVERLLTNRAEALRRAIAEEERDRHVSPSGR